MPGSASPHPLVAAARAGLLAGLSACGSPSAGSRQPFAVAEIDLDAPPPITEVSIPTVASASARPPLEPLLRASHHASVRSSRNCCKGMNQCKGRGGCKVEDRNDCAGLNECKGLGGCRTADCGE